MSKLSRAALFSIVCAPTASAQGVTRPAVADSSVPQIMRRVGTQPGAPWLRDILRQAGAQYPPAKLDEIADSLMTRAIAPARGQNTREAYTRPMNALSALVRAGARAPLSGRPYAGAFDRIVTVYERAPSRYIRAKALGGMLASPSRSRAVDYLRQVAESSDSTSYDAVEFLITDANGGSWTGIWPTASERKESIAALRALASRGRVTDIRAANLLESWISRYRSVDPPNDRS